MFDATTDEEIDIPPGLSLMGLDDVEYAAERAGEKERMQPAPLIHAPAGPMSVSLGYFVYAVKLDEAGEVVTGREVARGVGGRGMKYGAATILAQAAAMRPDDHPFATHVIVNDGTGKTFDSREMCGGRTAA